MPESRCKRNKTVTKGILITFRNSDKKITMPIRITGGPSSRLMNWKQFYQFTFPETIDKSLVNINL